MKRYLKFSQLVSISIKAKNVLSSPKNSLLPACNRRSHSSLTIAVFSINIVVGFDFSFNDVSCHMLLCYKTVEYLSNQL